MLTWRVFLESEHNHSEAGAASAHAQQQRPYSDTGNDFNGAPLPSSVLLLLRAAPDPSRLWRLTSCGLSVRVWLVEVLAVLLCVRFSVLVCHTRPLPSHLLCERNLPATLSLTHLLFQQQMRPFWSLSYFIFMECQGNTPISLTVERSSHFPSVHFHASCSVTAGSFYFWISLSAIAVLDP